MIKNFQNANFEKIWLDHCSVSCSASPRRHRARSRGRNLGGRSSASQRRFLFFCRFPLDLFFRPIVRTLRARKPSLSSMSRPSLLRFFLAGASLSSLRSLLPPKSLSSSSSSAPLPLRRRLYSAAEIFCFRSFF